MHEVQCGVDEGNVEVCNVRVVVVVVLVAGGVNGGVSDFSSWERIFLGLFCVLAVLLAWGWAGSMVASLLWCGGESVSYLFLVPGLFSVRPPRRFLLLEAIGQAASALLMLMSLSLFCLFDSSGPG